MSNPPDSLNTRLTAEGLCKTYGMGSGVLEVLRRVSLSVERGEFLAIMGSSGSGKSTLLHILGALDAPTAGQVCFEGHRLFALPDHARDQLRCRSFGFVYQFYHLLPELTVLENALFPQMILHTAWQWPTHRKAARQRCIQLLEHLGLGARLGHKPNQLSGGEQQRVAIARALANQPAVLLADEPTGNLDRRTGNEVLRVFEDLHRTGQTIVMVTHDAAVADTADRMLILEDGIVHPGS